MLILIAIHHERSNLSQVVYGQYRLYQPNLSSNLNPTPSLSTIKFIVIRYSRLHQGTFFHIPAITRPQPRPHLPYPGHAQAYPTLDSFFNGT
jgi:hypothetical protein